MRNHEAISRLAGSNSRNKHASTNKTVPIWCIEIIVLKLQFYKDPSGKFEPQIDSACKIRGTMWDVNLINVENRGDFSVTALIAVLWQPLMSISVDSH